MSYIIDSPLGRQLYQLLPEIYRTRDKQPDPLTGKEASEDLAKYLDAQGELLDLIHDTFNQLHKDTLPESSQDWLLPYFAQLLGAKIISPDSAGKHAEISHAVSWRQRKGTLACIEEIAEAVGEMELEFHEGWQRVAITPTIDKPIIPASVWDNTLNLDMDVPSESIRHPDLPAAMLDLRRPCRSVEALNTNPASKTSSFAGIKQSWRHANNHGVPCFPGSFDDVSRRTVDIRSYGKTTNKFHPKRMLGFTPASTGFFALQPIQMSWADISDSLYEHMFEQKVENGVTVIKNITSRIIEITDHADLTDIKSYRIEGINFISGLTVASGSTLELSQVEADFVELATFSSTTPTLVSKDCLFGTLNIGNGIAHLDSCSVLIEAYLREVDIIDSLIMSISDDEVAGNFQYSRIPSSIKSNTTNRIVEDCTSEMPVFFTDSQKLDANAVLAPDTLESIYAGASDDGEIGYFHHGRKNRPVVIEGDYSLEFSLGDNYVLSDVIFPGVVEINSGKLDLVRSAFNHLTLSGDEIIDDKSNYLPALDAVDCLFNEIHLPDSLCRLEYCTVLTSTNSKYLQASDCIFIGNISDDDGGIPVTGCIRYSRIPETFVAPALNVHANYQGTNTREIPVFSQFNYCVDDDYTINTAQFGEPGCGVLNPATPDEIRFGAEDGGEMGAFHHKYYTLKTEAMLEKMREFLPVGIEPALVHDTRLLHVPPEING